MAGACTSQIHHIDMGSATPPERDRQHQLSSFHRHGTHGTAWQKLPHPSFELLLFTWFGSGNRAASIPLPSNNAWLMWTETLRDVMVSNTGVLHALSPLKEKLNEHNSYQTPEDPHWPQPVDTPLLASRCHWFIAQVFCLSATYLESEVCGGETASAADWCPAQTRAPSSSPGRQKVFKFLPKTTHFPQTGILVNYRSGYLYPRSKKDGEQIVSWLVTQTVMSGGWNTEPPALLPCFWCSF